MARALRDLPGLILALRAARAWGARPTQYLGGSEGGRWTPVDRALAEGLVHMEETTGPHGIPMEDAMDPESDGWWTVRESVDYAQAAIDRYWAEHPDPEPGVRVVVEDERD